MEAEAKAGFETLPLDMLALVLGLIEISDLSASTRVCKKWRNITSIPWVLESIMETTKNATGGGFVFSQQLRIFLLFC